MARQKKTATLKNIAQATGYSVNTVSRALRDKDDIAAETRTKIKQVAQEMGHVNNMIAMSLRLGYTNTIAVVLGDISNPHFSIMMKEIEERARKFGYTSFLINTDENEDLEFKAIQSSINKGVDGIIICPTQKSTRNIEFLKESGIPFVLIGRHFDEIETNYVICSDELGGYQATKFLLEQGHRNILMLHGPIYISSAKERLDGYKRAHEEANIPVQPDLICEVPVTAKGCHQVLDKLFAQGREFSAVFAFSDMLAWDTWSYLIKRGKQVPQDYSLIGFDNIQSRLNIPFQLSSISSYKRQMSSAAVDMLLKKMKEEEADSACEAIIIDTKLVIGRTVKPPLTYSF